MVIKKGSTGIPVKKIQYKLSLTTDGIFGSGTEKKVKEWQEKEGLTSDGIVGEESWKRLFGCPMSHFSPIGIVVHSMSEKVLWEGKVIDAKALLQKLGLSVHALVHTSGRVETIKTTDKKCAHAGVSEHNGLENLNSYFLGFEVLVSGTNSYGEFVEKINKKDPYTEDQIRASTNLTQMWMNEYNILPKDVVRHSDVSGDNIRGAGKGKVDPGKAFPWETFKENIS